MQLNEQVGRRLRALREERRLSLSELARRSGVGKATLSELEGGRRNPTLETLYALTTALGVPLSTALAGPLGSAPAPVPALGEARGRAGAGGEALTALLTERHESAAAVTEVFRIRIDAGAVQRSGPHLPGTREHLYVLSGTAVVGDPTAPTAAGPGEYAHWRADRPHVYSAPQGDVEAVLFVRYPLTAPTGSGPIAPPADPPGAAPSGPPAGTTADPPSSRLAGPSSTLPADPSATAPLDTAGSPAAPPPPSSSGPPAGTPYPSGGSARA
jgi:transcriptional regulator with XRE-family HTH domain